MFGLYFIQATDNQLLQNNITGTQLNEERLDFINKAISVTRGFINEYVIDGTSSYFYLYSQYKGELASFLLADEDKSMDFIERLFVFQVLKSKYEEPYEKIQAFVELYRGCGKNRLDLTMDEFCHLDTSLYENVLRVFSESCARNPEGSHLILGKKTLEIIGMLLPLEFPLRSLEIYRMPLPQEIPPQSSDIHRKSEVDIHAIEWVLILLRQLDAFVTKNQNLIKLKVSLRVPTMIVDISGHVLSKVNEQSKEEFDELLEKLNSKSWCEIDCEILNLTYNTGTREFTALNPDR